MRPDPAEIGARCGTDGEAGCAICRDEAQVAEIVELLDGGGSARVRSDGLEFEAALDLLADVRPGDRVLVHLGFALSRLEEEA